MKTWIGTWERRGPAGGHFLPGTTAEAAIQTEMDFSKPFLWSSRPHSVSRGFRSFLASWGKGGGRVAGFSVLICLFVCLLFCVIAFLYFLFIDSFIRLLISILWLFIYLSYLFVCLLSIHSYLFIFHLFIYSFTFHVPQFAKGTTKGRTRENTYSRAFLFFPSLFYLLFLSTWILHVSQSEIPKKKYCVSQNQRTLFNGTRTA